MAGEEAKLGAVRAWVAALLPACPARDDVIIVTNELCANAVRHTASGRGGTFGVEITVCPPVVRVSVADGGSAHQPRVIECPAGEAGRGLLLVRGLSARQGVVGDHRGRLVWADIPWDGPQPRVTRGGPARSAGHRGRKGDVLMRVTAEAAATGRGGPGAAPPEPGIPGISALELEVMLLGAVQFLRGLPDRRDGTGPSLFLAGSALAMRELLAPAPPDGAGRVPVCRDWYTKTSGGHVMSMTAGGQ